MASVRATRRAERLGDGACIATISPPGQSTAAPTRKPSGDEGTERSQVAKAASVSVSSAAITPSLLAPASSLCPTTTLFPGAVAVDGVRGAADDAGWQEHQQLCVNLGSACTSTPS